MKIKNKIATGLTILLLGVIVLHQLEDKNPEQWFAEIYRMSIDTDKDGLSDGWEIKYFGTLEYDAWDDVDGDGLNNGYECRSDFVFDNKEVFNWCTPHTGGFWYSPLNPDSSSNGISDGDEFWQRGTALIATSETGGEKREKIFADVDDGYPYFERIKTAQEMGIIPRDGIFRNMFRPDEALSRSEALAFLVKARRLSTEGIDANKKPYADVSPSWWDIPYIEVAKNNNFVPYVPEDNTLRPGDNITRAEFLEFVFAAFGLEKTPEAEIPNYPFVDVKKGWWDTPYIVAGSEMGIMKPYASGVFRPRGTVKRAEAMGMIMRAMEITGRILN